MYRSKERVQPIPMRCERGCVCRGPMQREGATTVLSAPITSIFIQSSCTFEPAQCMRVEYNSVGASAGWRPFVSVGFTQYHLELTQLLLCW